MISVEKNAFLQVCKNVNIRYSVVVYMTNQWRAILSFSVYESEILQHFVAPFYSCFIRVLSLERLRKTSKNDGYRNGTCRPPVLI